MADNILDKIDDLRDFFNGSNEEKNYTLDELAEEMRKCVQEYPEKILAIHMFGIKYGKCIRKNKYSVNEIVKKSGINDSYFVEINKGIKLSQYVMPRKQIDESEKVTEENYVKFKALVEWFVKQLNINNKIESGTPTSGKGADGDAIQAKYSEWREYELFTLDCAIQSGYQSINSKVNYIHYHRFNVRPVFVKESKTISDFKIDIYEDGDFSKDGLADDIKAILEKNYKLSDLGLFDGDKPNDIIKQLYDDYEKVIITCAKAFEGKKVEELSKLFDFSKSTLKGENLIVYGTPGCGKSYHVDHDYLGKQEDGTYSGKGYEKKNIVRTTFYQDYSNTDFVGQILPKVNDDNSVEYVFNPGPFTKALIQAIKSPDSKVALVIEEINRGNAASIFGDIFQLLDRKNGVSEYGIVNVALMDYLNKYNFGTDEAPIKYKFDEIKIPGNMWIYATMNTSDQNVSTLDSAFTRRWKKERMSNSFDGKDIGGLFVPGMKDVTWEDLVQAINDYILEYADQLQTSEDKQIGVYFVDKNVLAKDTVDAKDKDKVKEFANKMMEYLWDDVSKLERELFFKKDLNSIDKVLAQYEKDGQVFSETLTSKINSKKVTVPPTSEDKADDGEED